MRRRLPFLHRRGKNLYFFHVDEKGKRREESLRTDNPELALQRYQRRMQEIKDGFIPTEMAAATLGKAVVNWLEHRTLRVATGTFRAEKSIVRSLVRELGVNTSMDAVADMKQICAYQNARLRAGISPKSVNNEIQVLALLLQWANLWHRVQTHYRPLRSRKTDIPDALNPEQCKRLVAQATKAVPFAVVPYAAVLALGTGMRSCEIKGLTLGDLRHDASHPYLIVRRATTKTDAGARRVALGQLGVWAIQKLAMRAEQLGARTSSDHLLPTDRSHHTRPTDPLRGRGYDPKHTQSSWETEWIHFREEVGILHRRFHDLRHTYITRAAESGVPIAVTQSQVGHLSRAMTEYYTHVCDRAQFKAARQIENHQPELLACIGLGRDDPAPEDPTVRDCDATRVAPLRINRTDGEISLG